MRKTRAWQWLMTSVLVAVAMGGSVVRAGLPASGGSQTNYYVAAEGIWVAHIFTASGDFSTSEALDVEYLIVGGGGGGGASYNTRQSGAGGAGGLFDGTTSITGSEPITVGAAGAGAGGTASGGKGGDSSAFGFTAEGGGGGAYAYNQAGGDGGCGGGAGSVGGYSGGTGSQGGDGASGDPSADAYGGGGGGAGTDALGDDAVTSTGGAGYTSSITGTSVTYAEGGQGGIKPGSSVGIPGDDADDNTGSGGEGSSNNIGHGAGKFAGGAGGSGIVVVRYQPAAYALVTEADNVTVSGADLQGVVNATNGTFTVYAFWSTNDNADASAWRTDDDAQSAEIDDYTDVMGQAVSNAVSGLSDGTEYFYTLLVSNATTEVWSPTNASFTTLTRPDVVSIVDDRLGGPIVPDTLVTYTITFSRNMNGGTITENTFTNNGSSDVTFGTVSTTDNETTVEITPTTDGTLQLAIKAGATVEDTEGLALDTSSAIPDDTEITVSSAVPPAVANPGVGLIGIETATLQGQITASNGPLAAVRFYLGTTDENENAATWDTNYVVAVGSISEGVDFTAGASDLVAGTQYFYRVYASNETDDAWSVVVDSFTTLSEATWTNDANGSWSETGNWTNAVAGFGGYPAKFDTLTLTAARTVTLDTTATVGSLAFGDVGNQYGWTLTPSVAEVLTLTNAAGVEVVNQTATIAAEIAGSDGLTKTGSGTLILSDANTYTNTTAVNAGTLQVDGSLSGDSAVTVASSATLRGSGAIAGAVSLQNGAALAAGDATTRGTLTIQGALTQDAGSTVELRINKTGETLASDLIDLDGGSASYAGTLTVTHSGDALEEGDSFTLFSAVSYGGSFGTVNLPALTGDLEWDYSGLTSGGSITVYSAALTLDGALGSKQYAGPYSTGGSQATGQGLNVNLGFFVDYLIVAGGGGGGGGYWGRGGGGGGGGGLLRGASTVTPGSIDISVGDGGTGNNSETPGESGDPSSAFGIEATGGGGGGCETQEGTKPQGLDGGSGGGDGGRADVPDVGGLGIPGQGNDGAGRDNYDGGGGGGAGDDANGSAGGSGYTTSIANGVDAVTYAAGGDGGIANLSTPSNGDAADNNTGNGGDGGNSKNSDGTSTFGGDGGSGIVVIRYPGTSIPATGGTITSYTGDGANGELGVDYWVHSFTTVGESSFDLSSLDLDARLGAEITGEISGAGDLVYGGPGRLTLSDANTYTGDTIITNGTLFVSGSLTGTSGVTVESGAAFGGGGSVGSAVTFEADTTFVASGTLDISGTLTLGANVTLDYSTGDLVIATCTSLVGTFTDTSSIPDGFDVVYGATEIKLVPTGGSVFRFR